MDEYAFTIKVNTKDNSNIQHLYESVFSTWTKFGCIVDKRVYERDSYDVMHTHGIVQIPKNLFRKKLCIDGYHYCFKEIDNINGWERYIGKDQICGPTDICLHDDDCLMKRLIRKLF